MRTDWRDQPVAVRVGEELDEESLRDYLVQHFPDLSGSLTVRQFPSGFSNLTYLIRFGEREMVLRRPPFGARIKSAHDMRREHTILSQLYPVFNRVPMPLHYCQDTSVLGAPFYLMSRLEGVILRPQMPRGMIPDPELMGRIAGAFIDNLVDLHSVDFRAAGLGEFGRPEGYIQRQIEGWSGRYYKSRTDDILEMDEVASWLAENRPLESVPALIHNDYKYDNLVLDPADWSRITGVLDWEMATIGDPLMDLGTALGYWVEAGDPPEIQALRLSPTNLDGNPTRAELVERYARRSGQDVSNILFYFVYGLFKLAVIVQQIYYRYESGYTQDPRFAGLITAVRACSRMAKQVIDNERIDLL
jgi:aminoglycoside phosphotransferase (APT) family kinase protein